MEVCCIFWTPSLPPSCIPIAYLTRKGSFRWRYAGLKAEKGEEKGSKTECEGERKEERKFSGSVSWKTKRFLGERKRERERERPQR